MRIVISYNGGIQAPAPLKRVRQYGVSEALDAHLRTRLGRVHEAAVAEIDADMRIGAVARVVEHQVAGRQLLHACRRAGRPCSALRCRPAASRPQARSNTCVTSPLQSKPVSGERAAERYFTPSVCSAWISGRSRSVVAPSVQPQAGEASNSEAGEEGWSHNRP